MLEKRVLFILLRSKSSVFGKTYSPKLPSLSHGSKMATIGAMAAVDGSLGELDVGNGCPLENLHDGRGPTWRTGYGNEGHCWASHLLGPTLSHPSPCSVTPSPHPKRAHRRWYLNVGGATTSLPVAGAKGLPPQAGAGPEAVGQYRQVSEEPYGTFVTLASAVRAA